MLKRFIILLAAVALVPATSGAVVVDLNPAQDNTIFQEDGSLSNGAGSWIFAGKNNEGTTGFARRALIRFDLSSIPSNATINAVSLIMVSDRGKSGSQLVTLYRANDSWGEGTSNSDADPGKGVPAAANDATWTHRFYSTTAWSTPGGTYAAAPSATVSVGNSGLREELSISLDPERTIDFWKLRQEQRER